MKYVYLERSSWVTDEPAYSVLDPQLVIFDSGILYVRDGDVEHWFAAGAWYCVTTEEPMQEEDGDG